MAVADKGSSKTARAYGFGKAHGLRLRDRRTDHRISVNVDADVDDWVKRAAEAEGVSRSAFVAALLGGHVDATSE